MHDILCVALRVCPYPPVYCACLYVCMFVSLIACVFFCLCPRPYVYMSVSPSICLKPGVHTNDFAPIYGRRAKKLGHASLTTVFRPSRLTLQPILRENLESPLLMYQPITTAVVTDACLNTRLHHGAYTSAASRESDRVVTMYVVQSAQ